MVRLLNLTLHSIFHKLQPSTLVPLTIRMSSSGPWSVYVTRRIPPRGMELLQSSNMDITQWDSDEHIPREELMKHLPGKDALICIPPDRIDKEVLDKAGGQLKVIGTISVGYEHIDVVECKRRGISIGYTPDVLTDVTAELTVALLLATSRRLMEGAEVVKSGAWKNPSLQSWMCGHSLKYSTVGIVGMGRIGTATASRLKPFGVASILYSGHSEKPKAQELGAEYVSLDELLQRSDFVICTCPMNDETKGMFNKDLFSKMKKSAIFVNTSRGGVVNQDDLYDALISREIWAAGLDVTSPEPLPTDHKLLGLQNCVILPHMGSAVEDTRNTMSWLTASNIIAALRGDKMPAQLIL